MAADPLRVGTLALTNSTQIQLSLNGGTTWATVGPKNARIYDVEFSPVNADRAAAYTSRGLYRSTDGGRTWQHVPGSTPAPVPLDVRSLLLSGPVGAQAVQRLNPANSNELAVVTPSCGASASCAGLTGYDTIYSSHDGGVMWSKQPGPGQGETAVVLPTTPASLLVGADSGIYTYDLRTGAQIGPVLGTSTIVSLSADVVFGAGGVAPPSLVPTPVPLPAGPSGASAVYAGTSRGRIYRSIDAGATWQEADTGLSTASSAVVTALAIAPGTGESIYAGTFTEGMFTSTDGGGHWHNVNGGNLARSARVSCGLFR